VTHFVLVHGGWHGAWCWDGQIAALERRGHTATAVQLPSGQVGAGATEYARVIAAAVQEPGSDVVVGHSLAGLALPLVPDFVDVRALVDLAALLPLPGSSWREQLAAGRPMADWFYTQALPRQGRDDQGRTFWPPDVAAELFFHDCPADVASAACAQLRAQAPTPTTEKTPLAAFPDVPSHFIGCRDDRAVSGTWASAAAAERLGVDITWMPGSHSPFLADPDALAVLLDGLVARHQVTVQERSPA
jgi:hypothetical protein